MTPRIYIKNHITGEEIEREMTAEEWADMQANAAAIEALNENRQPD